jgi:hypothetical protein
MHLKLHCVTVTNLVSSSSIRQGTQVAAELSMGRAEAAGKDGVMRWWWHGCRTGGGKLGLLVDLGQVVGGGPQLDLLISGVVADGRFRLLRSLHASG